MDKERMIKLTSDIIDKLSFDYKYRDETDLVLELIKANGEAIGMLTWLRKELEKCTKK